MGFFSQTSIYDGIRRRAETSAYTSDELLKAYLAYQRGDAELKDVLPKCTYEFIAFMLDGIPFEHVRK